MALKFQYVFAGKGVRPREIQGDPLVQDLVPIAEKRPVMSVTRFQLAAADGLGSDAGQRSGNTHDTHTTTPLGGGDGCDGFTRDIHNPLQT